MRTGPRLTRALSPPGGLQGAKGGKSVLYTFFPCREVPQRGFQKKKNETVAVRTTATRRHESQIRDYRSREEDTKNRSGSREKRRKRRQRNEMTGQWPRWERVKRERKRHENESGRDAAKEQLEPRSGLHIRRHFAGWNNALKCHMASRWNDTRLSRRKSMHPLGFFSWLPTLSLSLFLSLYCRPTPVSPTISRLSLYLRILRGTYSHRIEAEPTKDGSGGRAA